MVLYITLLFAYLLGMTNISFGMNEFREKHTRARAASVGTVYDNVPERPNDPYLQLVWSIKKGVSKSEFLNLFSRTALSKDLINQLFDLSVAHSHPEFALLLLEKYSATITNNVIAAIPGGNESPEELVRAWLLQLQTHNHN